MTGMMLAAALQGEAARQGSGAPAAAEAAPSPVQESAGSVRGWHGMVPWSQARYRQEDWIIYDALGAGDLTVVDVIDHSPAWLVGLRSRSWIIGVDGKPFNEFERTGAPIGTTIAVEAFHHTRRRLHASLKLIEPPKPKRAPRAASRARIPAAECGRVIAREDRPRWLTKISMARYLSAAARALAGFLCNRAINDQGVTDRWACQALALQMGFSRATIHRALAELAQAGFLVVHSGRKARRVNRYALTWPVEGAGIVVPFHDRVTERSSARRAGEIA